MFAFTILMWMKIWTRGTIWIGNIIACYTIENKETLLYTTANCNFFINQPSQIKSIVYEFFLRFHSQCHFVGKSPKRPDRIPSLVSSLAFDRIQDQHGKDLQHNLHVLIQEQFE
mmetsp:Transcript_16296/g.30866  ORF Transcript_16296/g.30866 Transcript_16296/m.30866 type:complete len:114 (-) Transcript_16296:895-1236(-)